MQRSEASNPPIPTPPKIPATSPETFIPATKESLSAWIKLETLLALADAGNTEAFRRTLATMRKRTVNPPPFFEHLETLAANNQLERARHLLRTTLAINP